MKFFAMALIIPFLLASQSSADKPVEKKKWWEKREKMEDLYFPHKKHMEVFKADNDPCMRCHPFMANKVNDTSLLKKLNIISNEPLKEICHKCHVVELTGGSECRLCHKNPASIWPDNHNFDYVNNHGGDSKVEKASCGVCHVNVSFCTDCHFRRDAFGESTHKIGYRARHGLEARISSGRCGKCHSGTFCKDCHMESR